MAQPLTPPPSTTTGTARIAVVGGGWAGLAAAIELATAGAGVTLFESARQLGGRARRVVINDLPLDNGQHILLGAYRETLRLMRTVGAAPETCLRRLPLSLTQPRDGFRLRLPRLPAPWHLALGLAGARGCGLGEKLAAVRFMRVLEARAYRLDQDISVAELLDRHGQRGVLRRLMWEPLCLAALNTAPEIASAQVFANVLRDSLGGSAEATDLLLPTTDLGQVFPDAAARCLNARGAEIRLGTRVRAIEPPLAIDGEPFAHIVIATAPRHAAQLLAGQAETAATAAMLSAYAHEPIGCAYLGYPDDITLPEPMLGLESSRHERLGQWAFDRGTLGGPRGLVSFVLSAEGAWDRLDDDELCRALHGELEAALGHDLPSPRWHRVLRERRATFSCRPGLPRPTPQTALPGLWLAGDYVYADYPGTLEGAVRSGIAAARGILASG
ncbi:hydroxysqualene dehydroxylase HpnE [Propionivibrio dicarboxylicus]|uniref:Squalene-associated FAD-dependent desaturase n=1 Tax=Propionivibrio dicarboxylicus TaxID=83767 RepID=A0A1G8C5B4_9RHOO|nr:hydroxysqualene dehydroxylase HpnE [Propionivibrio dicarboxylicus]SDH40716.1 squalene-associated FAD-dependent desaturase [Propionivibrio dicarboxylicus]